MVYNMVYGGEPSLAYLQCWCSHLARAGPPPAHEVWSCCGVSVLNFATVPWPLLAAGGWWLGGGMCVGAQNRLLLLLQSSSAPTRASIAPAVNQPVGCRCSHQQAAAQLTLHTAPGHNTHITTTTNNIVIVSSE